VRARARGMAARAAPSSSGAASRVCGARRGSDINNTVFPRHFLNEKMRWGERQGTPALPAAAASPRAASAPRAHTHYCGPPPPPQCPILEKSQSRLHSGQTWQAGEGAGAKRNGWARVEQRTHRRRRRRRRCPLPLRARTKTRLPRLQPARNAVKVKGVVARAPGHRAVFGARRRLVGLALDAQVHDVVAADGAVVDLKARDGRGESGRRGAARNTRDRGAERRACAHLNVPRPQRNRIPLLPARAGAGGGAWRRRAARGARRRGSIAGRDTHTTKRFSPPGAAAGAGAPAPAPAAADDDAAGAVGSADDMV